MSRHQRHIRLLDHLARLGYRVAWVSNGPSACRGKTHVLSTSKHKFGMSRTFDTITPSLVQIRKGMTPYLSFKIEGKNGDLQYILGWKHLAAFVQVLEIRNQREDSQKAKEAAQ